MGWLCKSPPGNGSWFLLLGLGLVCGRGSFSTVAVDPFNDNLCPFCVWIYVTRYRACGQRRCLRSFFLSYHLVWSPATCVMYTFLLRPNTNYLYPASPNTETLDYLRGAGHALWLSKGLRGWMIGWLVGYMWECECVAVDSNLIENKFWMSGTTSTDQHPLVALDVWLYKLFVIWSIYIQKTGIIICLILISSIERSEPIWYFEPLNNYLLVQ